MSEVNLSAEDARALTAIDKLASTRIQVDQFYIAINVIVFIANTFVCLATFVSVAVIGSINARDHQYATNIVALGLSLTLSFLGLVICINWRIVTKQLVLQHEVRFKALMDRERRYTDAGILSKTWDRLGDELDIKSPVISTFVNQLFWLSIVVIHSIPPYVAFVLINFLPFRY